MRDAIARWLDERTGLVAATRSLLQSPVEGGPRWWNSLGFAMLMLLIVEGITGALLSLTYSPSAGSAWASVYYIAHRMDGGWLVRGIHRFGAYAAVVLGGLWLLRIVLGGLYRPPREIRWWLSIVAFGLILGLGVTGNVLPWDQRAYWAAVVETTIAGGVPAVGPIVQRLAVGGPEVGQQTLTRFHALHVLILPGLLVAVGWAFSRAMGRTPAAGPGLEIAGEPLWPGQAFRHLLMATLALAGVVALAILYHGYPLDAPADPSAEDYPARPEWYFLSLNQLLKVFQGREYLATLVLPGVALGGLASFPLLGRALPPRRALGAATGFTLLIGTVVAGLTALALVKDSHDPGYARARARADRSAARAVALADRNGVPPDGAAYLLRRDPIHRGSELFEAGCAACHNLGREKLPEQWAPDLAGYGSYAWIRGLLEEPGSDRYFGKAPMCGGMAEWKETSKLGPAELDAVARYVATFAAVPADETPGEWLDRPEVRDHPGRKPYQAECAGCHTLGDPKQRAKMLQPAPDLFAWASDRWTARMIRRPGHPSLYGYLEEEQKMPGFEGRLTDADLDTLIRHLRGNDPAAAPRRAGPIAPVAGR